MAKENTKILDRFFTGISRDDKSHITGACGNVEELDIFTNQDYIQPEQIFSADAMPATTEIYAYTGGQDDVVYGYGKETAASKVRIVSVATGGADNPGAFTTLFTSADATNLSYVVSPIQFFKTSETTQGYLYYLTNASNTIKLERYDINAGTSASIGTLTDLDGSFDQVSMKVIFGSLYITNGRYIAGVDGDGTFTEKDFTLPREWEAVDIEAVADKALILCRNDNLELNSTKAFWWDLTETATFDDSFGLPIGGAQWILNYKETLFIMCATNGIAKFYTLPAFQGSKPAELANVRLTNIASATATQPISGSKMLSTKDGIVYFSVYKTDKTGIYALGQLDNDKPNGIILSKRYNTTDYSLHKPTAFFIQGSNFYGAFDDNGTASTARCESLNSPVRSSNAVYESLWLDNGGPLRDKDLKRAFLLAYPLGASTSLALSIASDYSSSFTAVTRPDATAFNTANGLLGFFRPAAFTGKKVYKVKVAFTSNTTDGPKLVGVGLLFSTQDEEANK